MKSLISSATLKLLALSMLKGVGPAALKKVAAIASFEGMAVDDLGRIVAQVGRALDADADLLWSMAQDAAHKQIAAAKLHGARILSPLDLDYPSLLAETKDDPFILYVKGSLAKDPLKSVAIIGTREPTTTGVVIAQRVARTFAEQGWSIVSGLALGCDALAHQAALDAGGHTVAVLAHGLQMISPSRHNELAQAILDAGGALVSEYPFGQAAQPQQFVKRDRTQAGMAQGVVMIQSDVKGGSLHASRAALDYERWLAVPYPTMKDLQNGEPKVQGNLVIADGGVQERAALLRCKVSALDRILVLRERADILRLAGADVDVLVALTSQDDIQTGTEEQRLGTTPFADAEGHETVASVQWAHDERAVIEALEPEERAETPQTGANSDLGSVVAAEEAGSAEPQVVGESLGLHTVSQRSSPKRAPRYHVAVHSVYGGHELTITQVPHLRMLETRDTFHSAVHDRDSVIMLATRLQHLQERLDEIKRLQVSPTPTSDVSLALHLQYFVEDVLVHMKRSVDELSRFKFVQHVSAKIDLPSLNKSHQLSFLEAKDTQIESHVDLVSTLDQIVKALPASAEVCTSTLTARRSTRRDDQIEINLDDLVHSFNDFVVQALGSEDRGHWDQAR